MALHPGSLIGGPEDRVRQPFLEAGVVAELLEQLGVVFQHPNDHISKRPVVLQPRRRLVGVSHGILVSLVGGHLRGDFLRDDLPNPVCVLPVNIAELIVERLDDVAQPV